MKGRDGREYPYVSSQCFKKYWRESLPSALSPIIREKDAGGRDKNQTYTSGNPIEYPDDDLFGYMIAGATEAEEDSADAEAQDPAEDVKRIFDADNIKYAEALRRRLLDAVDPLSKFILDKTTGLREVLDASNASESEL
jgi:CRISPR/Cas system-associated protein Cas7 (RAMP superfamily)